MWMSQQFPLLCEKPNTVAVSGKALLSQYPYCCIPNALCAVSLITECVGCNSCYSFIQTFCAVKLSAYISLSFCRPPLQLFLSDLFITWMLVFMKDDWLQDQGNYISHGKDALLNNPCCVFNYSYHEVDRSHIFLFGFSIDFLFYAHISFNFYSCRNPGFHYSLYSKMDYT